MQPATPRDDVSRRSFDRRLLDQWCTGVMGQSFVAVAHAYLARILPDLFGYHIVQIGRLGSKNLLESSRIRHRVVLDIASCGSAQSIASSVCKASALPIDSQCVDVVVLPHVLEFESDPHGVLREAERILVGEGHVVVIGFNPWSTWGLCRTVLAWRDRPPWCGRFYGIIRIKDWLQLLGFDIVKSSCFYFRPPLRNGSFSERLAFLEKLGGTLWPWFGGAYIVVGKKRLVKLIPMKEQWRIYRKLIGGGVTEPTTRAANGEYRS